MMCNKLAVINRFLLLALWCTSLATSNTAQDVQKIKKDNLTDNQKARAVTIEFKAEEGKQLTNAEYIKIRDEITAALTRLKAAGETSFHPGYNESDVKFVLIEPEVEGGVRRVTLVPRDGNDIELQDFLTVIEELSKDLKVIDRNPGFPTVGPSVPSGDITSTTTTGEPSPPDDIISTTTESFVEPSEITSTSGPVFEEVKAVCNWRCWLPILVGVLVLILLLLLLVCLVCYRKKRRRMLPISDSDSEDEVVDRVKDPKTGSTPPTRHPNGFPTPPGGAKQIDDKDGWIVPLSEFKDDDYKGFESVRF